MVWEAPGCLGSMENSLGRHQQSREEGCSLWFTQHSPAWLNWKINLPFPPPALSGQRRNSESPEKNVSGAAAELAPQTAAWAGGAGVAPDEPSAGPPGPKSEGTPGIWGSFPSPGLRFLGKGTSQAGLGGVRPSLPNLSILRTPCHILPRLRLNSAFFWLKWHRVASFLNLVFSSPGPPEPPTLVP